MKFTPVYDKNYYPMIVKLNEFKKEVSVSNKKPLKICVERNKGYTPSYYNIVGVAAYIALIVYFICASKRTK